MLVGGSRFAPVQLYAGGDLIRVCRAIAKRRLHLNAP
jgi:hypothetical protein